MNAISYALNEIKYTVPIEVLQIAFRETDTNFNAMVSLDDNIMSRVLRPRVLVDCNLVGGIETRVDLNRCSMSQVGNEHIVSVPKVLTGGKSIITALSIVIPQLSTTSSGMNGTTSPLLQEGMNLMNSVGPEVPLNTTRLELIGENTILVQQYVMTALNGVLKCYVENDVNMSNINPRAFPAFSKLVEYAVQSYIYNNLRVKIGKGYIYNGHELGVVTEVIENYSDAEEMYKEYRSTVWKKVAFMNNSSAVTNIVTSMF